MFKAYASSDSSSQKKDDDKDEKNTTTASSWLENKSFSATLPTKTRVKSKSPPVIVLTDEPKEEKKAILPSTSISTVFQKKFEQTKDICRIDRRRDRANLTVPYTVGVPRYGLRFCQQRPLGAPPTKPSRKEKIRRYFHQQIETTENPISDGFVKVDERLERLNVAVREQPHSFDAWKELIDYQTYLYKTQGDEEKVKALFNKQLSIIDRALELNGNRLQYRLCRLNLRTRSRLFDREVILNEWTSLIKDCLKSSDDRTINETWFSYVQYLTTHVDLFSIEKLDNVFSQYFSTYIYHMQTRSDKERRYLSNHMIDMFHLWTCLLNEAGYAERAVALYQTMIELNFPRQTEIINEFSQRVEQLKTTWNSSKIRFGEPKETIDRRNFLDEQLKILSEEENRLFNSDFSSWILIEDKREHFYQWKILNEGIHFHSSLLDSLTDSSQIDEQITKMTFDRSIRPFLFQCQDSKQFLQIFVQFLMLINGQPRWNVFQEILNRWKLNLSTYVQQEVFLDDEFSSLFALIHRENRSKTEKKFSYEFISRIYEQMLTEETLKTFRIDFLLLFWYYLAENIRELKEQNSSLYKVRLKSLQSIIKKFLSLDEYRTCLRLYTHYGRLEFEYFQRLNESRRIFDLCFQTIRTNPNNFNTFDSFADLCSYLSTMLKCEFDLFQMFDRMLKSVETNSIKDSLDKSIDREKLTSSIEFVLKKLFPDNQFNEIISLVIDALKNRKISKWDQQNVDDWPNYLRQNVHLALEILFIFLNYSFLLGDPFEKLHQIFLRTILPLINDQRTKFTQMIIDDLFRFYLSRLWNHLFNDRIRFDQSTNYLNEIFDQIQTPSMIFNKFLVIYSSFLPLYGSSVDKFEEKLSSFQYNQKQEYRLMNKTFVLEMNFLRHIKIQRAIQLDDRTNSGYEHRVRHILRQMIFEYPSFVQLWMFYEHFERYSPNNEIRLKAVLYDALQNCPWAKSFYFKSISNVTNETEWKFFLNVMMKSQLHILFSIEEFELFKELFQMKTN